MIPVIALVGRPNVGKSTLFNALTKTQNALVADFPGLTRDRQYGQGHFRDHSFIVIDTGGLGQTASDLDLLTEQQSFLAIKESNLVFFLVDAKDGLTPKDESIAHKLRSLEKEIFLVVNKMDAADRFTAESDFHRLGFKDVLFISAAHRSGVEELLEEALPDALISESESESGSDSELETASTSLQSESIKIAIIGRPNVGKSTLVNRLLNEERLIVYDAPHTTRDSIFVPMEREGQSYTLIDTAGVRRRARVTEKVEKFSIVKTLQSIEAANVVIVVLDAVEGVTEQDLALLGFVVETGRALVIAINKWDGLDRSYKNRLRRAITHRLAFVNFAKIHTISALHGTGVGDLWKSIQRAYHSANKRISTPEITHILQVAVEEHAPPLIRGRRIKLRYAHMGGHEPPLIIIHGNQTELVPETYRRYLSNTFRKVLKLEGTPVRIEFKGGKNPFAKKGKS